MTGGGLPPAPVAPSRARIAYPFRYEAQDPHLAPGISAPYQPRFDWNLWFASFGTLSYDPR